MRKRWLSLLALLLALSAFLLGGCSADQERVAALKDAFSQTRAIVKQPELVKLAERLKGSPEERRVAALFSPEGQKLFPPRAEEEYKFGPPVPGKWPPRILLLDKAGVPWSIVVQAEGQELVLTAYGLTLERPLMQERLKL